MEKSAPMILTEWELQYLMNTTEMQPSHRPWELPDHEDRARRIRLMTKLQLELELIKRREG